MLKHFALLTFLTSVLVSCATTSGPDRTPSAVDSLVFLNRESAAVFAKRLCVIATESLPQGGTAEDRNCRNEVAKQYSEANLQSRTKMALFICDEMSSAPTWQRQAHNRLVCYRNATGLIKNENLDRATVKCGDRITDTATINQQWADCFARSIQELDGRTTEN